MKINLNPFAKGTTYKIENKTYYSCPLGEN